VGGAGKSQNSIDLTSDQHLWAREFYRVVSEDARSGRSSAHRWKMSRAAAVTNGAPQLGEHNAYLLGEILGLSAKEQQRLGEAGVTR
jgi:crotonobetainyl-CoA:carnitine CoA-transferase CaiB-like acyl-CoA transferase